MSLSLFSIARLLLVVGVVCYFVGSDGDPETNESFSDRVSNTVDKATLFAENIPAFCDDYPFVCDMANSALMTGRAALANLAGFAHQKLSVEDEGKAELSSAKDTDDGWEFATNQHGI